MSFYEAYQSGNLVLPVSLLFHLKNIFPHTEDYLVWQYFYLQNTTQVTNVLPSHVAEYIGKSLEEVNHIINRLQQDQLLSVKTITLDGNIETVFDASPALIKLDALNKAPEQAEAVEEVGMTVGDLVKDFEREMGRLLSPFELEDLQKTVNEDKVSPELVQAALKEAVFYGKANWRYIQAIIRNWRKDGITRPEQIEQRRQEREQAKPENVEVSDAFKNAMNLWE